MDYHQNEEYEYVSVVDTLVSMFGDVLSKDVLFTVVESCGGDLNLAVEAAMNISNDTTTVEQDVKSTNEVSSSKHIEEVNKANARPLPTSQENITTNYQCSSYARVSQNTGAVPKNKQYEQNIAPKNSFLTDQLHRIMTYHNQGSRILIFMRGVPGSGKSYLAKQLIEIMIGSAFVDFKTHICSTDDFFMARGGYQFDRFKLRDAHEWNQKRVQAALKQGLSPLIIDNTNIEVSEMVPYLCEAVKNGYIIEVVEPNTPWARKAHQLMRRNTHNVPIATIKRMLDKYEEGITGEYLVRYYRLSYPVNFVPPVMRTIPEFINKQNNVSESQSVTLNCVDSSILAVNPTNVCINETHQLESNHSKEFTHNNVDTSQTDQNQDENFTEVTETSFNKDNTLNESNEDTARNKRDIEIQKQLEEMEKIYKEWEHGETWDNESQETVSSSDRNLTTLVPKPPRRNIESFKKLQEEEEVPDDKIFETVKNCEDWTQISMFMTSCNENTLQTTNTPEVPKQMISSSTFMETGDTDLQKPINKLKIISSIPRDINLYNVSFPREKIPDKRMLDKSTMTNELLIVIDKCKNEEQHFTAFRNLFKHLPKMALRDIFDKCCGDVNWAVDIVLGDMANNQLQAKSEEDLSDTEEEIQVQCNCLAAYNVVPNTQGIEPTVNYVEKNSETSISSKILLQKKPKTTPSETSVQLKRQIEKNVVISDDHYSKHCLKLRKMRRGEYNPEDEISENNIDEYTENSSSEIAINDQVAIEDNNVPSTSKRDVIPRVNTCTSDEEPDSTDEVEKTVYINVNEKFLPQLDELFGRKNMTYPDNIVPKIKVPLSLLNEINAYWMESLMYQLDEQDKQNAKMLQEDEEFARQIAMKENELAQAGKEPNIPDFKEIMDMDFALSLYQKDVAEWRNKEPGDIAARMTRDKLYNMFPHVSPDILAELLMAHDNNFEATVEVLLMSTGKSHILEEPNGLNKFVMEIEMKRQEKLLEEEKKALSEVEWPLLPKGEKVDMSLVEQYRTEAGKHLAFRNTNCQKAQEYIRRGMPQVANYYSDIAAFHKLKYEQANSMAAVCLMQVHASNSPDNATIDLHYLRVGEAKESLDLFLDSHIQKLKESNNRGPKCHTLFFITGRGLHSHGRPKLKPAVRVRLFERGLLFRECNPGLLTAKVYANDKLSYQVP